MPEPIRILILEDDPDHAQLYEFELRRAGIGFSARHARTEPEFRKELDEGKPEIILSDYSVSRFYGISAPAIARERCPDAPFIFVSAAINEDRAIEALKSGATDFIAKDRLSQLGPAVQRALREVEERRQRRRLEDQLLQSEKMAAVGQLIGGVAHELNNPLTSILGYIQLLHMENPGDTRLHQDLAVIKREASRCSRLIKSLLAFARKHEHQRSDSDLNGLVGEILDLKACDLRRAQIQLVRDLPAGLPAVFVDPHQIQQVLLNLLNNAEQAMERTKGTLTVRTRRSADRVELSVSDTGPGIAPENLQRIFEPFFTTKAPDKGTGLGLSICSKIVKDHGGALSAESRPGEGARLTVSLPASAAPPDAPPLARRRCGKIMLVDDQSDVLHLMTRALRQSGREVEAFTKPDDALSALTLPSGAFDLVISDYQMPGMDGEKFYWRAVSLRPALARRFIILTGQPHLEAAKPFAGYARLEVLVKPFDLEQFERSLARVEAPSEPAAAGGAQ